MTTAPSSLPSLDALPPADVARACAETGVTKAGRDMLTLLTLGILAGAFIALGAVAMVTTLTGASVLPWGVARLLGGCAFSLGLILVVIGGAELFTGDCLMVVAWRVVESQRLRCCERGSLCTSAIFWALAQPQPSFFSQSTIEWMGD